MSGVLSYRSCPDALFTSNQPNNAEMSDEISNTTLTDTQCDSLVENLENNDTVSSLCLKSVQISHEQISKLAKALKYNTSLTSLELSGCKIDADKLKPLCEALIFNNSLTSLNLSNNNIEHTGARHLAWGLHSDTRLTYLNLWGNKIGKFDDYRIIQEEVIDSIDRLFTVLKKFNRSLRWLELGNNQLGGKVNTLLPFLDNNQSVSYLGLSQNNIPSWICAPFDVRELNLARALSNHLKPRVVDLSNNYSMSEALKIVESIHSTRTPIILHLSNCNIPEDAKQKIRELSAQGIVRYAKKQLEAFHSCPLTNNLSDELLNEIARQLLLLHLTDHSDICASLREKPKARPRELLYSEDFAARKRIRVISVDCDYSFSGDNI